MKIALFGYGKMGKMIERTALDRAHSIVAKIDVDATEIDYSEMDVAIDFSTPDAAYDNIVACLNNGVPIISGTTGWLHRYDDAVDLCRQKQGAFIYASNFSLGVNVFFELNAYLAVMMRNLKQYQVSMEEIHHTQKLDKPSATAISLANAIINHTDKNNWNIDNPKSDDLFIDVKRIDAVPGTHSIFYQSEVDTIEIKHTAHNRDGFALGAIVAAEWLVGKKGVFTMKDVLDLS